MLFYSLLACSAPTDVELLDHDRWETEGCAIGGTTIEAGALELETAGCSPIEATALLIEPIEAGDSLEIVWWHDFLAAEQTATGVFSLYLDEGLLYRAERSIPGPPRATTEVFEAPVSGERITIEVANHGANTWNLLRLTKNPSEPL